MYFVFGVADFQCVLTAESGDGAHGGVYDVEDSDGGDGGEETS